MKGWKFRRQVPISGYFADFVCHDAKLVIELDGSQHAEEQAAHDLRRSIVLGANGFRILRFLSNDVFSNLEGVLIAIAGACGEPPSPRPSPASGRGGDGHCGQ